MASLSPDIRTKKLESTPFVGSTTYGTANPDSSTSGIEFPPRAASPLGRRPDVRASPSISLLSRPPTASKRQKAARALSVREWLNLPPVDHDGALLEPARDVIAAYTLCEEYDTRGLQSALKHRAELVGDIAVVGLERTPAADLSSAFAKLQAQLEPKLQARLEPNGPPIAFFFPFGCVVIWGFTEAETTELFAAVEPFALKTLDEGATDEDRMTFAALPRDSGLSGGGGAGSRGGGREGACGSGGGGGTSSWSSTSASASTSASTSTSASNSASASAIGSAPLAPPLSGSGGTSSSFRVHRLKSQEKEQATGPTVRFETATNLLVLGDALDPLAKLAVSYAFAQSGKLAAFEAGLEALSEQVRPIPESLAATGTSHYSRADIGKLIGHTFLLSSTVNLYTDILDDPDFFWENDAYHPVYNRASNYLDVADRTQILNSRLEVLSKLLESLNTQLATEHSTHLEWIVIWLIVAEVVLECLTGGHSFFGLGTAVRNIFSHFLNAIGA